MSKFIPLNKTAAPFTPPNTAINPFKPVVQKPIDLKDVKVDTDFHTKPTEQAAKSHPNQEEFGPPKAPSNQAFYEQGVEPIKQMQAAIINFSKDLASHSVHSVPDRHSGENDTGEFLNGSNAFMNFVVNKYVNKANPNGKQVVTTDTPQPTRQDTSKENDHFRGILNTMSRLGSGASGKETTPDGIWGWRTTNALKEVYSLCFAMNKVQEDMGMKSDFDPQVLQSLHDLIPTKDIDINEKIKSAVEITKDINTLRNSYDNFSKTVLDKYGDQISQQKSLYTDQGEKPSENKPAQVSQQDYDSYKNMQANIAINGKPMSITPANLVDLNSFKTFLVKNPNNLALFNLPPEEVKLVEQGSVSELNKLLQIVINGFDASANLQGTK